MPIRVTCAPQNPLRRFKVRLWFIFGRTQEDAAANLHEENPTPRLGAYAIGKHRSLDLAISKRNGGKARSFFDGGMPTAELAHTFEKGIA